MTASDEAEVRFLEAGAGAPPAIKTWWYPGERIGYEFVYPKAQARRLAQRTRQPVLTTRNETSTTSEAQNSKELTRISPTGSESQVAENEAAEAEPAGSRQPGQRADSGSVPPRRRRRPGRPLVPHALSFRRQPAPRRSSRCSVC